jgi:hypothetical protein
MKLSKQSRRFHDPWGSKFGNIRGSVLKFQYQVGKGSLGDMGSGGDIHGHIYLLDKPATYEHNTNRYVRNAKRSVERLKR